jgi:hypothetical protein
VPGAKVQGRWAAERVHWLPAWRPQGVLEDCLVRLAGVLVRPAWRRLALAQLGAEQEPLAWRPQVVSLPLQVPQLGAVQVPPVWGQPPASPQRQVWRDWPERWVLVLQPAEQQVPAQAPKVLSSPTGLLSAERQALWAPPWGRRCRRLGSGCGCGLPRRR